MDVRGVRIESVREDEASQGGVRAVNRALEILLAFTGPGGAGGLTVIGLQERTRLSRPTLYRLLATLSRKGFVASSGDPQRFKLGPAIAQLVNSWNSGIELATIAHPIMQKVWQQTGETVALFVPQGEYRLCIAEIPSEHPLSFRRGVGYRELLVRGASGRAILAYQPARRYPAQLQAVRTQGYAVSRDELIKGAVAVAVPFFDASGKVAGSLGIFGPGARLASAQVERFGALLGRKARELSEMLGAPSQGGRAAPERRRPTSL